MNFLAILSTLVGAVHTVEALMPASAGKDKFDAAMVIVEAVAGDVTDMLPALQKAATTIVDGLRAVGVFKAPAAA